MNHNTQRLIALLCSFSFFSLTCSTSFLEKIEPIKTNLFKTSPQDLCAFLEIAYEPVPVITAQELQQELSSNGNILVVNVLTKNYYDDCHITGSINAPLTKLVDLAQSWDTSQKIVVYCALDECDAGEKGCILLQCMGFKNVVDYRGGIKEWYQLGNPTTGPAVSEYLHWKSAPVDTCRLYPQTIVCSRQIRWINRYQQ